MNSYLNSRDYGIVFSEDYRRFIRLMQKDFARRGITMTGDVSAEIDADLLNKASTMSNLVENAKKIGYSSNETFGVIIAEQMRKLQTVILASAKKDLIP